MDRIEHHEEIAHISISVPCNLCDNSYASWRRQHAAPCWWLEPSDSTAACTYSSDDEASMRNLIFCLILSCVIGCASNHYYVRKDGRQTVILDEGSPFVTDRVAYVTDYEELQALPNRGNLKYVGTKDGYHIVRWWQKILPAPSAVDTFAVPKDQFAPAQPFKFEGFPGVLSQSLFDL